MLLPNQSRFKAGGVVGWWLAGLACSSALGQDFEKQTTAALDRDRTLYVVNSTNAHAGRKLFVEALRPGTSQAALGSARRRKGGIGDLPEAPRTLTWKLGQEIVRPAASGEPLSAGTLSAGVASVAVAVEGVRLYGALGSERCALAGAVDRGTANGFLIQPFVNYNLLDGWYVTSLPVINADWQAPSGQKWTVPIGASIGRFARFGEVPVSVQAGYYYNIERPDGGSDWAVRFQLRLLFPG
jgi:hypothetical protein